MSGLIAVLAFFIGIPMVLIGWVWSVVVAKKVSIKWMIAMLFVIPLPLFTLMYWHQAKKPFWVVSIGVILILITLMLTPES